MSKVLTATARKVMQETKSAQFQEEIMKASKTNTNTLPTSEVLFQKMGSTWYVFTEVAGDMVYSALPHGMDPHTTNLELFEVIEDHMSKVSQHYGRKPEVAA